jgi:hypothetical protein
MSLSALVIRLIFLGLPGVIAYKLYKRLRGRSPKRQWEDVLDIAVFSILSYLSAALASVPLLSVLYLYHRYRQTQIAISWLATIQASGDKTFAPFLDAGVPLNWLSIATASICAVPIA